MCWRSLAVKLLSVSCVSGFRICTSHVEANPRGWLRNKPSACWGFSPAHSGDGFEASSATSESVIFHGLHFQGANVAKSCGNVVARVTVTVQLHR